MSGSESEALSAIVVGALESAKGISAFTKQGDGTKLCSACRHDKPVEEFVGSTPRHQGKDMRTCSECRKRNRKTPAPFKEVTSLATDFLGDHVESSRNGRATRRQTVTPYTALSNTTATAASNRPTRKSLAVALTAPGALPSALDTNHHHGDNTDTDDEYYQPPAAPAVQSNKRHSTPPHSAGEDAGRDNTVRVGPPPKKRPRTAATPNEHNDAEVDARPNDEEDEEPILNANGRAVGMDLAAFAVSLGRLSQLLMNAGKCLDNERIGALESEIHHDWRVDEMATFVEGFLKGASANSTGRGW